MSPNLSSLCMNEHGRLIESRFLVKTRQNVNVRLTHFSMLYVQPMTLWDRILYTASTTIQLQQDKDNGYSGCYFANSV